MRFNRRLFVRTHLPVSKIHDSLDCICLCTCVRVYVYICVCVYVCVCSCPCLSVVVYVYAYVCLCVSLSRQTNVIAELFAHEVNILATDSEGNTPMHVVRQHLFPVCSAALFSPSYVSCEVMSVGLTPSSQAVRGNDIAVVKLVAYACLLRERRQGCELGAFLKVSEGLPACMTSLLLALSAHNFDCCFSSRYVCNH